MGCDIHANIRCRTNRGDGYWYVQPIIMEPRDYRMFSAFCGVRAQHDEHAKGVVPVRGLPSDWKNVVNYYHEPPGGWDVGDHSMTWLTCDEFAEAIQEGRRRGALAMGFWEAHLAVMRALEAKWDGEAQLVIGFDN